MMFTSALIGSAIGSKVLAIKPEEMDAFYNCINKDSKFVPPGKDQCELPKKQKTMELDDAKLVTGRSKFIKSKL